MSAMNAEHLHYSYLFIGILLLQHHRQALQEGAHARSHVQAQHSLLLQRSPARRQHVIGRDPL